MTTYHGFPKVVLIVVAREAHVPPKLRYTKLKHVNEISIKINYVCNILLEHSNIAFLN